MISTDIHDLLFAPDYGILVQSHCDLPSRTKFMRNLTNMFGHLSVMTLINVNRSQYLRHEGYSKSPQWSAHVALNIRHIQAKRANFQCANVLLSSEFKLIQTILSHFSTRCIISQRNSVSQHIEQKVLFMWKMY